MNYNLISAIIDPKDVPLICALPLGSPNIPDNLGWHLTKSSKYTVKSRYHTSHVKNIGELQICSFGLDIRALKAFTWRGQCPYFMWQASYYLMYSGSSEFTKHG